MHPVFAAVRHYVWLSGLAAEADQTLAGLTLGNAPPHVRLDHEAVCLDYLGRLDEAHLAVRRCLSGR